MKKVNDDFCFNYKWLDILLHQLPKRQQIVIKETIFSNTKLKFIARKFQVTEPRVIRIRKQALNNLRKLMEGYEK